MPSVPNTVRRHGVFYFRRVIPADLQPLIKRTELCCSLGTSDPGNARRLSRSLYLAAEDLFVRARIPEMLTDQTRARLVQDFYAMVLGQENAVRLRRRSPLDEETRLARVAHYADVAKMAREHLATDNLASADMITSMLIDKHGLTRQLSDVDVRSLQQAMLRAGCDLAEAIKARYEGDFNYKPRDALLQIEVDKLFADVTPASRSPSPPPAKAPTGASAEIFSLRAEAFREAQVRRNIWEAQTSLQARKTYALFLEHAGDRPLSGYLRTEAAACGLASKPDPIKNQPTCCNQDELLGEWGSRSAPIGTPYN